MAACLPAKIIPSLEFLISGVELVFDEMRFIMGIVQSSEKPKVLRALQQGRTLYEN